MSTRSGASYSPFNVEDAVFSQFNFSIEQRLILDNALRIAREDADDYLDEEVELEDDGNSPSYPVYYAPPPPIDQEKWAHLPSKTRKKRERRAKFREFRDHEIQNHIKDVARKRRHEASAHKLETYEDTEALPIASTAWVGSGADPFNETTKEEYSLEDLLGPRFGMRLVDWDAR